MRFFHLADLHIGKKVNEFSMIEDQRYILNQIVHKIDEFKPECILIAGDIYDKSIPSVDAVSLFNEFLNELASRELTVIMISGNHDSADRLAFASDIIAKQNIFISPVFNGDINQIVLTDEYGDINVYMLPYIKPAHVRKYYPDAEINSYDDAVRTVVSDVPINKSRRNIILAHQFITGAARSESEEIYVGTLEDICYDIFDDFDYVALGHLHAPQHIQREGIRYAGSPLKYSFSEINHKKSIACVDLNEKQSGDDYAKIDIQKIELIPIRDMVHLKGKYSEMTAKSYYSDLNLDDYYKITLTDESEDMVSNVIAKLRSIYPNIMKLEYDNRRTRSNAELTEICEVEKREPLDIISQFYKMQNNEDMNDAQIQIIDELIQKVWGEI